MKVFNAFQCVLLFAFAPFGIAWLYDQTFRGANAAWWAAIVGYVVAFGFNVAAVTIAINQTEDDLR